MTVLEALPAFLGAVDEQIARESARQALSAASAACAVALKLSTDSRNIRAGDDAQGGGHPRKAALGA